MSQTKLEDLLDEDEYKNNTSWCSEASTLELETDRIYLDNNQFDISKFPDKYKKIQRSELDDFPRLEFIIYKLSITNNDCNVGFQLVHRLNDIPGIISYIVGGLPRDILLDRCRYINDVDIVVFGMSTNELQNWLTINEYQFSEVNSNFTLNNYKVDINVGNKLLVNDLFTHCDSPNIDDNISSRDCVMNSAFLDLRNNTMYDMCNGQVMKDIKNLAIRTNLPNLRTVYRFRPTFFFRLIKLSIQLNATIDPEIWKKISTITTDNPVQLSTGWSMKLDNCLNDSEFIKFMDIMQDHEYLQKFIRDPIWERWMKRMSSNNQIKINSLDFPPLGRNIKGRKLYDPNK